MESQIQTLREKIASTREALSKVVEENERRERHNTRIGIILEQTEQFQEQLVSLENGLQSAEDKLTILEILKKHLVQTVYSPTRSNHLSKN